MHKNVQKCAKVEVWWCAWPTYPRNWRLPSGSRFQLPCDRTGAVAIIFSIISIIVIIIIITIIIILIIIMLK